MRISKIRFQTEEEKAEELEGLKASLERLNSDLIDSVRPKKLRDVLSEMGWAEKEETDGDRHSYFGWNRIFIDSFPLKMNILEKCPKCDAKTKRDNMIVLYYFRSGSVKSAWQSMGEDGWVALCKKCLRPVGEISQIQWIT